MKKITKIIYYLKKIDMQKIIILDFSDAEVYIKDYDATQWDDAEDFLSEHGFDESNCQWMIADVIKFNID